MVFNGTVIVTIKPHFFWRSEQSYFINFKRRAMKVKVSVFVYLFYILWSGLYGIWFRRYLLSYRLTSAAQHFWAHAVLLRVTRRQRQAFAE